MDNDYINNLLAKHFAKETTELNEKELAGWIKNHQQEYLSLKIFYANIQTHNDAQFFAVHKAWQKMETELGLNAKQNQTGHKLLKYIGIAATLLIIGFSGLLFYANTAVKVSTLAQTKTITLSDGSMVTLNKNSSISYNRYFLTARNVKLNGEAFFDVKHNAHKPFKVQTNGLLVNVLGTSFLVKASQNEKIITVITGKVAVQETEKGQNLILTPNQSAKYANGQLQKDTNANLNLLSWKTKVLTFKNNRLQQVFDDMEKYYGVKFIVPENLNLTCPITTRFDHELLTDALKELNFIAGINYSIKGNTIWINGIACK